MEYGWNVVHYAAPTIDIYRAEPDWADSLDNYQRLGVVLEDVTQSMCADYLDDLQEEVGGDRISVAWDSLVVSCKVGDEPRRRAG